MKSLLVACVVLVFSFLVFMNIFVRGKSESLRYADDYYVACVQSSSDGEGIYKSVEAVLSGDIDSALLKKYRSLVCNDAGCKVIDYTKDEILYIVSSFILRGNKNDLVLAAGMLSEFVNLNGNSYLANYLTGLVGYKTGDYKRVISDSRDLFTQTDAHGMAHSKSVCDSSLKTLGWSFSKEGDFLSRVYIHVEILNK